MNNLTCLKGCDPAEPDNCLASAIVTCPLGYWRQSDAERSEQRAYEDSFLPEYDPNEQS